MDVKDLVMIFGEKLLTMLRLQGCYIQCKLLSKKYSGLSFVQFRNEAFDYFSIQVKKDINTDSSAIYAREHKHFVASEEYPQWHR